MAMRRARPEVLIDLNDVPGLSGVEQHGDTFTVGAMTRQRALLDETALTRTLPALEGAIRNIGHPATRARGTIGGSLCHAHPSAELPALLVATGAEVELLAHGGRRRIIPVDSFLTGRFRTAIEEDELLTAVRVQSAPGLRMGFSEIEPRSRDFAIAGAVAGARATDDGGFDDVRVVVFAIGEVPRRLTEVEKAVAAAGGDPTGLTGAAAIAADVVTPNEAPGLTEGYRRRLASVVVHRALRGLMAGPA